MYFRLKSTKSSPVLQLVETFRNEEGSPRQRILLSLGNLSFPKELWRELAKEIKNRLAGFPSLVQTDERISSMADRIIAEMERKGKIAPAEESSDQWVTVRPEQVSHHNTVSAGPAAVVLHAWNTLGINEILRGLGFSDVQRRDAAISISNRLLEPCSEHALPQWVVTSALPDLLGVPLRNLGDDRFYRISDRLLDIQSDLEARLSDKEQSLFGLDRTIFLYDLSNTFFEGTCPINPDAKRTGNSKHHRTDAPHLAFGMVLDEHGFVIKHRTFPGNTHDATTLLDMVKALKEGEKPPLVVIDGGFSSEKNLESLKEAGLDYITVKKRPQRLAYQDDFADLDSFRKVSGRQGKTDVLVSFRDEGDERLVFCYSQARAKKEHAMLSRAEDRLLIDLGKLATRLKKGRLKELKKINQAIGRLRERHPRAARYYDISLKEDPLNLAFQRKDADLDAALEATGGYILRTNRKNLDDDRIWHIYIMLTRVEAGFRALKSNLGLRPIFHHTKERCEGHIFITVLAYHLLHWIEFSLRAAGNTMSWPTVKRMLSTHGYTTIVFTTQDGKTFHIRKPGVPDTGQREIYRVLGVDYKTLPCYEKVIS